MAASIKPTAVHDLKQRVFTCLDRLADRDTLAQATAELHLIARSLSPETSLSPFLACLLSVDAAHKAAVRVHSLRLIAALAAAHRDHLAPYVPKILSSSLLRRIRDPDTAVRLACSDASSSLARYVSGSPFKVILEPLLAALLIEQDYNAQIGSAMCLSAAIESSESVEAIDLRRTLPKMVKLVRSESFKAKSALLGLIGSVVAADGGGVVNGPGLMGSVVSCATELLCSEDWAVRKAAAEALHKVAVAVARRELLAEAKDLCVNTLQNRRFDKVKIAREAMNRSLEAWKEVNCLSDEDSPSSQSKSSISKGDESSRDNLNFGFETPQSKQNLAKGGSSLSDCSSFTDSPPSSKCSDDLSYEIPQLKKSSFKSRSYKRSPKNVIGVRSNLQPGRKSVAKKPLDLNQLVHAHTEEVYDNNADFVELSLIRKQLFQIETQQSYLMELLQTFMGTSQSAINSLETRVSGLETALGGIYHDLAAQNGRTHDEYAGNSGCTVPGPDFTKKFRRRNESGCFPAPKPCGSSSAQILPPKEGNFDTGETRGIPLRDSSRDSERKVGVNLSTRARLLEISQRRPCSGGSLDAASPVTYTVPMFQRTQHSR